MALKKPKLPNKPSAIIRMALTDLSAVEKDKRYDINMCTWHSPLEYDEGEQRKNDPSCEVCMAGAVIANAGNDMNMSILPDMFDDATENKLLAIDCFREGDISRGLDYLKIDKPRFMAEWVEITGYYGNKTKFKKQMSELADVFEEYGL
jgi:hypothetical protein